MPKSPPKTIPRASRLIAAAVGAAVLAQPAGAQCRYDLTILPAGPGDRPQPYAVDDAGGVVGVLLHIPDFDAFLWRGKGPLVRLPMPSGPYSIAYDVNSSGHVVGEYTSDGIHGFIWDGNETRTLASIPGMRRSEAYAVNDAGVIVGFIEPADGLLRPAAWIDDEVQDLSTFFDPFYSGIALNVNDRGQVVGHWQPEHQPDNRAFWLDIAKGVMIDIGNIPGGGSGEAYAINNRGSVVVEGRDPEGGTWRSFLWRRGEGFVDLGVLPGDTDLFARDINERGLIPGTSRGPDNRPYAALWHDGVLTDLNGLIDSAGTWLRSATAITNAGVIVGTAQHERKNVAYMLTPIDPPRGDVTGDCAVDATDLRVLLEEWGACTYCIADLTDDSVVNLDDLLIVLSTWS